MMVVPLDPWRRWRLRQAVARQGPARLAQTFAAYCGTFYDRTPFDLLAREVRALYAADDAERAERFRSRLDARLAERFREPVDWEARR